MRGRRRRICLCDFSQLKFTGLCVISKKKKRKKKKKKKKKNIW